MAFAKEVEIERLEVDVRTATVGVKINKVISENGVVVASSNHRVSIAPGQNMAAALAAINAHLTERGFATIPAADASAIGAVITAVRNNLGTPPKPRAID